MRRDFLIAILLAVAAIPIGVVLMAAPLYFDISKQYLGLFFWGGILIAVILIGAAVAIAIRDEEAAKKEGLRRPLLAIIGMVIFGTAFIACAGWYFWPRSEQSAKAVPNPLDQTIQLSCEPIQVPDTIPAGGWNEVMLTMGMGVAYIAPSLPAGSKNVQAGLDYPPQAWRCRFENFGAGPVVNVEADLTVRFQNLVLQRNGYRAGNTINSITVVTPRTNLGTGAQNAFDFYMRNYSDHLVAEVILPRMARVQAVGHSEWKQVTLIPPKLGGFDLFPFKPQPKPAIAEHHRHPKPRQNDAARVQPSPEDDAQPLLIECNAGFMPTLTIGPNDRVSVAGINVGRVDIGQMFLLKGGDLKLNADGKPPVQAWTCAITNKNDTDLVNLKLTLHGRWWKTTKEGNTNHIADFNTSGDSVLSIPSLSQGDGKPFHFYVVNYTDNYVELSFAEEAVAIRLDTNESIRVPVRSTQKTLEVWPQPTY